MIRLPSFKSSPKDSTVWWRHRLEKRHGNTSVGNAVVETSRGSREQRGDRERGPAKESLMEEVTAEPSLDWQMGTILAKGRLWGDSRDIHVDKKLGHVNGIQGYRLFSQSGRWRWSRWLGMLRYGTESSLEHMDALLRSLDLIIKRDPLFGGATKGF